MLKKLSIIMVLCIARVISMEEAGTKEIYTRLREIASLDPQPNRGELQFQEYCRVQREEEAEKLENAWGTNKSIFSWLPKKSNHFYNDVKLYCLFEDPICRTTTARGSDVVTAVINNDSDKKFAGRTYFALVDARLPFFQEISSFDREIKVLVLADGLGRVGCLVPYALQNPSSRVYINELSMPMVEKIKARVRQLPKEFQSLIEIIPGDCRNILKNNPNLKESFDLIYCQHLEHFFNPIEHRIFLEFINNALTLKGKAFFIAETFPSISWKHKMPDYLLYLKNRKVKKPYSGFLGFHQTIQGDAARDIKGIGIVDVKKAWIPEETAICGYEAIPNKRNMFSIVQNKFTPEIYQEEIGKIPSLTFKEAYYLNTNGVKSTYETDNNITSVVAIAEKILSKKCIMDFFFLGEIFAKLPLPPLMIDQYIFLSLRDQYKEEFIPSGLTKTTKKKGGQRKT